MLFVEKHTWWSHVTQLVVHINACCHTYSDMLTATDISTKDNLLLLVAVLVWHKPSGYNDAKKRKAEKRLHISALIQPEAWYYTRLPKAIMICKHVRR